MAAITTREKYVEEGQSAMIASGKIVVYSKGLPDLKENDDEFQCITAAQ